MVKSMTGYGRSEHTSGARQFIAEIKSINNRYRDIVLRIPKTLQALEDEIKSQVSYKIRRGRVEVFVQIDQDQAETGDELGLNEPLVKSYIRVLGQLSDEFGLDKDVRAHELCQMRDVVVAKPEEVDIDEIREGLREVLESALDSNDEMRIREGEAIEEDFKKRLELIEGYINHIETLTPNAVEDYRRRLREKIEKLSENIEVDENRVIQEVAIFADKCDITEEIVRLRSHLQQFRKYLSVDDAIGRRLDFLMQEMHREANTMSVKANDSAISVDAVEIKAEMEKIREQIQNVE